MRNILFLILVGFALRFVLQAKQAYEEAEDERLNRPRKKRNQPGRAPVRDESHYLHVLGLSGNTGPDEVKEAYRRLAPQYHPDRVNHLGPKLRAVAEQEMKEINEAYGYFKRKLGIR